MKIPVPDPTTTKPLKQIRTGTESECLFLFEKCQPAPEPALLQLDPDKYLPLLYVSAYIGHPRLLIYLQS